MTKVKVKILYYDNVDRYGDNYLTDATVLKDTSEWVEIEEEDAALLSKYKHRMPARLIKKFKEYTNFTPVIIFEPENPKNNILEIVKYLKEEEKKDKADREKKTQLEEKRKAAYLETKRKKEEKVKKLAEEKERLMLEELQKKYGNR